MRYRHSFFILLLLQAVVAAQGTPIQNYTVGPEGCVQITVSAAEDRYYQLQVRGTVTETFTRTASLTPGRAGQLTLTEPLGASPESHYRVMSYPNASPSDADVANDLSELFDPSTRAPLNAVPVDGIVALGDCATFQIRGIP
ncbi:hypothetical protein [Neolewinella antarctica]|uniref:Uncharacterized protein n=1 Tax=Neolewinella antarctica TaxID=442734 RepID=A0ABX0X8L7_9BACT|nr:hypothetical protein [Neolewinella antarctica]NJC25572.1 hypothetical protein [Neolewinella antarctica]